MNLEIFENLGFTKAETKIYTSLLEIGPSSAGGIIEKSGLQNSVVHMALNKLISKGFVNFVKEGKRSIYNVNNPKSILEDLEDKKLEFEKILPELIKKKKNQEEKIEITSYRGINGIKEIFFELLESGGKEHNTMGSPKESLIMGDVFWHNFHRKRASKKIKAKLLFNESLKDWCSNNNPPLAEVKFMKESVEPITETIIKKEIIAIIIWSENPVGVIIRDKSAAKSYNEFFKILWEKSKR